MLPRMSQQLMDKGLLARNYKLPPDIPKYLDKVIIIEDGRSVDVGRQGELFERSSVYKNLMEPHDTFRGNQAINQVLIPCIKTSRKKGIRYRVNTRVVANFGIQRSKYKEVNR